MIGKQQPYRRGQSPSEEENKETLSYSRGVRIGGGCILLLIILCTLLSQAGRGDPSLAVTAELPSSSRTTDRSVEKITGRISAVDAVVADDSAEDSPVGPVKPIPERDDPSDSESQFPLREGPWSEPLAQLILAGKQGSDVTELLMKLLECQPAMGDQSLQLLLEGGGSLHQKRALLIALGTALSLNPAPPGVWNDRRGCLEWAVEMWIDGVQDLAELDRWLWQVQGIDGHLAFAMIEDFISDPDRYPVSSQMRARWRKVVIAGLQSEVTEETPPWLEQWAVDWIDAKDPEFRRIALGVLGKVYSQADPHLRKQLDSGIRRQDAEWQLEAGRELLRHVESDHMVAVIDDWANFFIRHEYRGEELLDLFHRSRDLPLEPILLRRGDGPDSESYRLWILFGALGGRDQGGNYPADWMQTLEKSARLDQAQVVRYLALRLCALGWGNRPRSEFIDLVRLANVSPVEANHAAELLGEPAAR